LNAKGSINKAAKSTARVIPVIFKVFFQFMVALDYKFNHCLVGFAIRILNIYFL
jgi:hypothetical protein